MSGPVRACVLSEVEILAVLHLHQPANQLVLHINNASTGGLPERHIIKQLNLC